MLKLALWGGVVALVLWPQTSRITQALPPLLLLAAASAASAGARERLAAVFGLDLRALATFRVLLALCALADLADRATVIRDFYTDDGACPRHW